MGILKDQLIVLVSWVISSDTNPFDCYIYELPRTAFDGTKFYLTGAQQVGKNFPMLYQVLPSNPSNTMMALAMDNTNAYILFQTTDGVCYYNLANKKVRYRLDTVQV